MQRGCGLKVEVTLERVRRFPLGRHYTASHHAEPPGVPGKYQRGGQADAGEPGAGAMTATPTPLR
jgi:hypothetical protein